MGGGPGAPPAGAALERMIALARSRAANTSTATAEEPAGPATTTRVEADVARVDDDDVSSMTVARLREELRRRGEDATGRKDALAARLRAATRAGRSGGTDGSRGGAMGVGRVLAALRADGAVG